MNRSIPFAVPAVVAAALSIASCASSPSVATPTDPGPSQPRTATYTCADGTSLIFEALQDGIRVRTTDGATLDFPASPPGQNSRFGEGANAIVIEDGEALVMTGNNEPLACRR